MNGDLTGLADEGAYLLMCKDVLPGGLLGLMLGGMIFATASSLNGTLNISAGVFTNDIYHRLFPNHSEQRLMKVARWSTIGFGITAIIVALLIPLMGGIVNVVISLAALTGVPLYLPIIWTLFSKRQNATSVMTATLLSLLLNGFFKFVTPYLFGFSFDRAEEMVTGVSFPIIILLVWEIIAAIRGYVSPMYQAKAIQEEEPKEQEESSDNRQGQRVIGIGITLAGLLITILGIVNTVGRSIVLTVSTILMLIGLTIFYKSRTK